ncbi:hypothetical protein [Chryseobacterium luteum]|nr:hypothetical protein [Chryseobacterium luteum]
MQRNGIFKNQAIPSAGAGSGKENEDANSNMFARAYFVFLC